MIFENPIQLRLKWKHRMPKSVGRNSSRHNDGRRNKRNKTGVKTYDPKAHVLVYDAGRGSGRMQTRVA